MQPESGEAEGVNGKARNLPCSHHCLPMPSNELCVCIVPIVLVVVTSIGVASVGVTPLIGSTTTLGLHFLVRFTD